MNKLDLTYSETVYMFADKFISKRSKFVNYERHPNGEKFPVKMLGEIMVTAAVVYLEKRGYIRTNIKEVKKLLVFNGKDVFAERLNGPSQETTGIEEILLQNFKEEVKIQKAVYNLLTSDDVLPWGHIVNISKQSLVKKGYICVEQEKKFIGHVNKYSVDTEKVKEVEALVNEVHNTLNEFYRDEKYSFITKAVSKGISARVEHQSSDD